MTGPTAHEAGLRLLDPATYADEEALHGALGTLRRESPVHWVEGPGYNPFWAVTRHADVLEIERQSRLFVNEPRQTLLPAEVDQHLAEHGTPYRTLIQMDEPDHRVHRALAVEWFKPGRVRRMEDEVRALARRAVDDMAALGGECDFVGDVALHLPLRVILSTLGLPESDYGRMLQLTQEVFGTQDPDVQRASAPGDPLVVMEDFFAYFAELTTSRRRHPTDDLASVLANARIDGELLGDKELCSYYLIIATAGHDTTSATLAGGLLALVQRPDEWDRLRADPALIPSAVEEMLRWVSPLREFMRTATEDYDLGGVQVRAGDALYLSFPSANRDEAAFVDPFRFDVGRTPNRHLAFGFGIHTCLGAALARLELRVFFEELLPRLRHAELAGDPAWTQALVVGGLKRLPITYDIAPTGSTTT